MESESSDDSFQDAVGDEGNYEEPMSLADHQILVHSARRLVKKYKTIANKRRVQKKNLERKLNVKRNSKKSKESEKVVLVPRNNPGIIKIIRLPLKLSPVLTKKSKETSSDSADKTDKTSTQNDNDPVPSTSKVLKPPKTLDKVQSASIASALKSLSTKTSISLKTTLVSPTSKTEQQKSPTDPVPSSSKSTSPSGQSLSVIIGNKKFRIKPSAIKPQSASSSSVEAPKAIVYPKAPDERPPLKIKSVVSSSPLTYNRVFEESTKGVKYQPKTLKQAPRNMPNAGILPRYESVNKKPRELPLEMAPGAHDDHQRRPILLGAEVIKKIPLEDYHHRYQMLKAELKGDEEQFTAVDSNKDSNETSKPLESCGENTQDDEEEILDIPERPELNNQLMETLATYRMMARCIMSKMNILPFDIDKLDDCDLINIYRTLKK